MYFFVEKSNDYCLFWCWGLSLTNGSKLQIKHLSAEKFELVGEFDAEKSVYERPSVDLATHFQTIKITTDQDQIKVRLI